MWSLYFLSSLLLLLIIYENLNCACNKSGMLHICLTPSVPPPLLQCDFHCTHINCLLPAADTICNEIKSSIIILSYYPLSKAGLRSKLFFIFSPMSYLLDKVVFHAGITGRVGSDSYMQWEISYPGSTSSWALLFIIICTWMFSIIIIQVGGFWYTHDLCKYLWYMSLSVEGFLGLIFSN